MKGFTYGSAMVQSTETENKQLKTLLSLVVKLTGLLSKYKQQLEGMRTNCTCVGRFCQVNDARQLDEGYQKVMGEVGQIKLEISVKDIELLRLAPLKTFGRARKTTEGRSDKEAVEIIEMPQEMDKLDESLKKKSELTSNSEREEETSEQSTIIEKCLDLQLVEDGDGSDLLLPERHLNGELNADYMLIKDSSKKYALRARPKKLSPVGSSPASSLDHLFTNFCRGTPKKQLSGHANEKPLEETRYKDEEAPETIVHATQANEKPTLRLSMLVCTWPGCDKTFVRSKNLRRHLTMVHKKERYSCDYPDCDKNYSSKEMVKLHQLSAHSNRKPFACLWPGCDYRAVAINRVNIHMKTHVNEMPFECQHEGCGRKFRSKVNLKRHEWVHKEQRRYVCSSPGCGAEFRTRQCFAIHLLNHKGLKPYVCDWPGCEFRTTHLAFLKNHRQRIHERVKKFKCTWPGCEWRFFGKHTMMRHYNKKHRQKDDLNQVS